MKKITLVLIILVNSVVIAQNDKTENTPENLIKNFFEAFHAQDTIALRTFAHPDIKLQSVSMDEAGNTQITTDDYAKFLNGIAAIPADATFEERIHEYRVEQNGLLATVTTPYTLYFNDRLYHCGVNSFELVKFNGEWKIVYLIDTRVKEDCN